MADLILVNEQIRQEADDILDKRGLRKILDEYGFVHLTGSYLLGLMTWRDLDIYLENDDLSETRFFDLGERINSLLNPVKMSFRNERIAKTKGLPPGLYWGIYLGDERQGAWKIDVWALPKEECKTRGKFCDDLANKISNDARLKILSIKSQCWADPQYRKLYTSNDIYTSVLEKDVSNFEDFKIYLRHKFLK